MSVRCGSCGTLSRARAKFCDECGSALDTSDEPAEFKYVTVLFADVVRSMDIADALELERYREVMGELVTRSAVAVQRYGGGQVDYTGDGVMAVFGAPIAMEDHAFHACMAALEVQREVAALAADVERRDGVSLRLRVGLNSGQVIAGDIGSAPLGYTTTGRTVGFAQRMESAAPPGGVMISESTARLVERVTVLSEPEWVTVKGAGSPVCAYRLLGISGRHPQTVMEANIVGRRWELALLDTMIDRAVSGRGGVVNLIGAPGIGKSRVAREAAASAAARGVEVFWSYCESHTVDVPFHAVAELLRASSGVADTEGDIARRRLRDAVPPDADPQDLLLLEDLLGIADPGVPRPQIDPEARRRRLTGLINTASLARTKPAVYIVEDAQWIDAVSESMFADFLAVVPHIPAVVLITSRPEYSGSLSVRTDAQHVALGPLEDSDVATLVTELLGSDPSVAGLAATIAERAAGNPFFVEEMVRELAQTHVLTGERGSYRVLTSTDDVSVPVTVQAAIEARIDRLSAPAKRTLSAAAVVGARFREDVLVALGIEPDLDELRRVDLIDQIRFTPSAEFAFRHPLIRAVAYESQLKADRAGWHRRVAAAVEEAAGNAADENAALIAEHLQAAGDGPMAYLWHMRAATWAASRDLGAARASWERARRIADELPEQEADTLSTRIAPRMMLCATEWQAIRESRGRFEELRELCAQAGDKFSLAVGMTGPLTHMLYTGRSVDGAPLATEQLALLESIGEPSATVGLMLVPICIWFDVGDFGQILRWSQTAVDLAGDDHTLGSGFGFESPLAGVLAWRAVALWWLGRPGWRECRETAIDIARRSGPTTFAAAVTWTAAGLYYGVLSTDDATLELIEEAAVRAAEGSSNVGITLITFTLGVALLNRNDAESRARGLHVMVQAREMFLDAAAPFLVTVADLWTAREQFRTGDVDRSLETMRRSVDDLRRAGRIYYGLRGAAFFVQSLLERGHADDVDEARRVTETWASCVDENEAIPRITLVRLRALLARAEGDEQNVRDLLARYRTEAQSLGLDSQPAWIADMA
ncbi:cyclase [Mycolicibacterium duvalii]|uniref:Cyclase n=1 Tax=Mycolicibacterium duvalii TaxID=39688 RepID=A0A7I7JVN0_9MYCO|nr:adenylate/guanylate cyclase domain-containing protein [Mycolicibacterium duvalii]MCV7367006.1 AAA family ATPase [Mycolicibacterium duvalii]PEG40311.1 cyclase [Mycolicibacterium duvalii]BBX15870.1 cyclase [Mycolicibacterium duvalii]